jgi:epoxyqueuosine reductase
LTIIGFIALNKTKENSELIKSIAKQLGFTGCGISKAQKLDDDARRIEKFLQSGYQGNMYYLENNFELRTDPRLLVPGARSVVSLLYNYFPKKKQNPDVPQISKYAYGEDYHTVIKEKLKIFIQLLREKIGSVEGRVFVDSAPVLEKSWAARSGLGWIGKHTNLINKQHGSFFFLAELIIDLELDFDTPITDYCGTCTRCVDACPTDAILPDKVLDASRCISYLTIELRDAIPQEFNGKSNGWIFGCDICQDVCPWNRFSKPHNEPRFIINELLLNRNEKDWEDLTEEVFNSLYKNSPINRTKFEGMKRNLRWHKSKKAE